MLTPGHAYTDSSGDVGGQKTLRTYWKNYFEKTDTLIWVVDATDRERIDEAKQELHRILSDREMKECLLLVFANKQDLPGGVYRLRSRRVPGVLTRVAVQRCRLRR